MTCAVGRHMTCLLVSVTLSRPLRMFGTRPAPTRMLRIFHPRRRFFRRGKLVNQIIGADKARLHREVSRENLNPLLRSLTNNGPMTHPRPRRILESMAALCTVGRTYRVPDRIGLGWQCRVRGARNYPWLRTQVLSLVCWRFTSRSPAYLRRGSAPCSCSRDVPREQGSPHGSSPHAVPVPIGQV